jgi:acyl carrier protein
MIKYPQINKLYTMGLDSVELVMEVEKYFGIQIPDPEAEKILTIQNMVDCVARHLSVSNNSPELRDTVVNKIQSILIKFNLTDRPLRLTDPFFLTLSPKNKSTWQLFINEMGIDIPKPETTEKSNNNFFDKIKSTFSMNYFYDWKEITLEQFASAICAKNCSILINSSAIKNTYEIFVAVASITVDKIGVDYYEITPEKSFTNDLGVD